MVAVDNRKLLSCLSMLCALLSMLIYKEVIKYFLVKMGAVEKDWQYDKFDEDSLSKTTDSLSCYSDVQYTNFHNYITNFTVLCAGGSLNLFWGRVWPQ